MHRHHEKDQENIARPSDVAILRTVIIEEKETYKL